MTNQDNLSQIVNNQMLQDQENRSVPIQKKTLEEENKRKQEEMKQALQKYAKKLIMQIKVGCKKEICFAKYCKNNKFCKFSRP